MKYTVILRASVATADCTRTRTSYSQLFPAGRVGEFPADSDGKVRCCTVRRPIGFQTLPVWIAGPQELGGRAVVPKIEIRVNANWEVLNGLPGTTLWLPNVVCGRQVPPKFMILNGDDGTRMFERCGASGVHVPPQAVPTRLAGGSLYRRVGRGGYPGDNAFQLHYVEASNQGSPNGVLNPWMVEVDRTTGCQRNVACRDIAEAVREHRADLHIDVPPRDWLRARIHTRLAERWHAWRERSKKRMPPIPTLLFGRALVPSVEPDRAATEGARAFLVLDGLEGTFVGGGECAQWRAPRWLGHETAKAEPLIQESLVALGAELAGSNQGGEADGAADGWNRAEIPVPSNAESEENAEFDELACLIRDAPEKIRGKLAELVYDARVSEVEAKEIESVVEEARRDKAAARDEAEALNRFIGRHIVPRSNFEVILPCGPEWLAVFEEAASKWRDVRGGYRLDPKPNGSLSATTWLRLVEPPGDERLEVPERWDASSYRWKRHFLVGLFRPGAKGGPRWILSGSSRLGIGRLGDIELGSDGDRIETPKFDYRGKKLDWPSVIDL